MRKGNRWVGYPLNCHRAGWSTGRGTAGCIFFLFEHKCYTSSLVSHQFIGSRCLWPQTLIASRDLRYHRAITEFCEHGAEDPQP